jgi:hypothetical protein
MIRQFVAKNRVYKKVVNHKDSQLPRYMIYQRSKIQEFEAWFSILETNDHQEYLDKIKEIKK